MIPLIVLISVFIVVFFAIKIFTGKYQLSLSGRVAMSVTLVFTAVAHFAYTEGMAMMLPEFIPYKKLLVYITGIIELAAAIGLLLPKYKKRTATLLILFFIMILPANIYAAMHEVNYQTGNFDGEGTDYLWLRIPIQIFYIFWTWYFGIRKQQ